MTPDLGVVSLSPTLGVEMTEKKSKNLYKEIDSESERKRVVARGQERRKMGSCSSRDIKSQLCEVKKF